MSTTEQSAEPQSTSQDVRDLSPITRWPEVGLAADFLCEESSIANAYDEPFIQVCGSCGHQLAAYHSGYKAAKYGESADTGGQLAETLCPNCFNANFRHSSVIATESFANRDHSDNRWYRQVPLARADKAFWHGKMGEGISVVGGINKEYLPAREHEISQMGFDWTPQCPACGKSYDNNEFDFHHWDYEKDRGCMLCRDCHNHIHRGLTATEQSKKIGEPWLSDAIERVYNLSVSNGVEYRDYGDFRIRFHLPQTIEVAKTVDRIDP